eukprot:GHVU01181204.1.p1 GENE.GHVU01181204.1~~GHVU01181204.1.p1  ORF type:complete len:232 (-),score=41.45 GHVU01181204.1:839-1498(-)
MGTKAKKRKRVCFGSLLEAVGYSSKLDPKFFSVVETVFQHVEGQGASSLPRLPDAEAGSAAAALELLLSLKLIRCGPSLVDVVCSTKSDELRGALEHVYRSFDLTEVDAVRLLNRFPDSLCLAVNTLRYEPPAMARAMAKGFTLDRYCGFIDSLSDWLELYLKIPVATLRADLPELPPPANIVRFAAALVDASVTVSEARRRSCVHMCVCAGMGACACV